VKFEQYNSIFSDFDCFLAKPSNLSGNIIEPQLENIADAHELIVSHPLKSNARFILKYNNTPFMLEDTMLVINCFSKKENRTVGLPGHDTKNWWNNLGNEGVLYFLENETDRTAFFMCTIGVLIESGIYIYASEKVEGTIAYNIAFSEKAYEQLPETNPFYFHQIFIPSGANETYACMQANEFKQFDYRRKCVQKIIKKMNEVVSKKSKQLRLFE